MRNQTSAVVQRFFDVCDIVYHGLPCFAIIYHDLPWFTMIYHDLPWFTMIYHDFQYHDLQDQDFWPGTAGLQVLFHPLMMSGALLLLGRSDTEGPRGNRWMKYDNMMKWSERAETETAHIFNLCSSYFALPYVVQLVCWMFLERVVFNFLRALRVDGVVFREEHECRIEDWFPSETMHRNDLEHDLTITFSLWMLVDHGCLMFWSRIDFWPCLYVKLNTLPALHRGTCFALNWIQCRQHWTPSENCSTSWSPTRSMWRMPRSEIGRNGLKQRLLGIVEFGWIWYDQGWLTSKSYATHKKDDTVHDTVKSQSRSDSLLLSPYSTRYCNININPPTPLGRWRRAYWDANSHTKCSITFVNVAVAISALGGGVQKRFRTETRIRWCLRDSSTIFRLWA